MKLIIDNTSRRFMIRSTQQKINVFLSICEKNHLDRDTVINSLMLDYIRDNLIDDDLLPYVEKVWDGEDSM